MKRGGRDSWCYESEDDISLRIKPSISQRLSKLEDFQTLKFVKVKVKSSWARKTFQEEKSGAALL